MLRRFLQSLLALVPLLISSANAQDSTALENTLLWRIEGNGLAAPSYLYGTCHVEDARVFRFSDSVIPALKRCSTVATELRLDSMMWQIFTRLSRVDSTFDLKNELSPKEYNQLKEMVQERLGLALDDYRHMDPFVLRLILDWMERKAPDDNEDEESDLAARRNSLFLAPGTFLDAWLARYGRLQRKEVIGLETYEEQLAATDTLTVAERVRQALEDEGEEGGGNPKALVETYAANDMAAIEQMRATLEQYSPAYHRALLVVRNHTMAKRMIALMGRTTLFTAVGVLHLPGPDGLIALLRAAGYRVTPVLPVYSSAYPKLPPLPSTELQWDSASIAGRNVYAGFSVPTPAFTSPFTFNTEADSVRMSMAMDIETGMTYLVMLAPMGEDRRFLSRKDLLQPFLQRFASRTTFNVRSVTTGEFPAMEVSGSSTSGKLVRARAVVRGSEVYVMVVEGGTSMLSSRDPDRFFASLRFTPSTSRSTRVAVAPGVAVLMPAPATADTGYWSSKAAGRGYFLAKYTANSPLGATYTASYTKLAAGAFPPPEQKFTAELLVSGIDMGDTTEATIQRRTLPPNGPFKRAAEITLSYAEGGPWIIRRVFIANSGTLVLTSIRPTPEHTAEERAFFDSLQVAPLSSGEGKELQMADANCTVTFPGPPVRNEARQYATIIPGLWGVSENLSAESWSGHHSALLEALSTGPYFRTPSIDTMIGLNRESIAGLDSLQSERSLEQGGVLWREFTILPAHEQGESGHRRGEVRHVRVGVHGSRIYTLSVVSQSTRDTAAAQEFFRSFRLIDTVPHGSLLASKTARLLNDFFSTDSGVMSSARETVSHYKFFPEDLPDVYKALKRADPTDTTEEGTNALATLVWSVFIDTNDQQSVGELYALHTRLRTGHEARAAITTSLARIGTREALDTLMLLLPRDPIHREHASTIASSLVYGYNSLDPIYPAIIPYADSAAWRSSVIWVTRVALDSGRTSVEQLGPEAERLRTVAQHQLLPERRKPSETEDEFTKSGLGGSSSGEPAETWERTVAAALLGHLPLDEASEKALRHGLDDDDYQTSLACVVSLLRHGKTVAQSYIQTIAEEPLQGLFLYRALAHFGLLQHFPKAFATQEKISEGLVAEALIDDEDQLNVEDIELMAVRVVKHGETRARAHLYRYRYSSDGEWYPVLVMQPEASDSLNTSSTSLSFGQQPIGTTKVDALVEQLDGLWQRFYARAH